jgi:hypothetical protein
MLFQEFQSVEYFIRLRLAAMTKMITKSNQTKKDKKMSKTKNNEL